MKKLFLIIFLASIAGCKKDDKHQPSNSVIVIYELESQTADPFVNIYYGGASTSSRKSWSVSGIGTFEKRDTVTKGNGAFFDVRHATSDKWKIRVKKADGTVLSEGQVKFQSGTPSYYYSSISVTIE
jgi:hypothetical protein